MGDVRDEFLLGDSKEVTGQCGVNSQELAKRISARCGKQITVMKSPERGLGDPRHVYMGDRKGLVIDVTAGQYIPVESRQSGKRFWGNVFIGPRHELRRIVENGNITNTSAKDSSEAFQRIWGKRGVPKNPTK